MIRRLWSLIALVVGVRLLFWAITGLTIEDSLISLRYAENLASGHGMNYNPGERVFGASTPLYVLLLAGLTKIGLPALIVAKLLAVAADGATVYLWGRWLLRETGEWRSVVLFALLFGISPLIVPVSVSGMETAFALLLMTIALAQATTPDEEARVPEWLGLGVPLGTLMLVRPDGAIAAVVILGLRLWRTRRVPWAAGLVAALIVLPWLVVATLYYGTPVPHSIPAKAAAYNLHRKTIWPNFWGTLAEFAPTGGAWWKRIGALALCPFLIAGLWHSLRTPRIRPLGALFLLWWAYLVLPKTLLFTWYFPLLMMPVFVLGALGLSALRQHGFPIGRWRFSPIWELRVVGVLALVLVGSLIYSTVQWRKIQRAERTVRQAIGLWLKANTPEDSRIAMEPIGYIGYYSGRRILDEVGLVSPEMVPLNREGAGWFGAMLGQFRPDYIVERPGYLLRNRTLNSGVALFNSVEERDRFLAEYEPLVAFGEDDVPNSQDYRFVIFGRRSPESVRRWQSVTGSLPPDQRKDLILRATIGPVDLGPLTVSNSGRKGED